MGPSFVKYSLNEENSSLKNIHQSMIYFLLSQVANQHQCISLSLKNQSSKARKFKITTGGQRTIRILPKNNLDAHVWKGVFDLNVEYYRSIPDQAKAVLRL